MNCKTIKDESCESCEERRLCRTFLGLKELDEYDNTDKLNYKSKVAYVRNMPVIVTATRNPLLGIEWDVNVNISSIPVEIINEIHEWVRSDADSMLRPIVDTIGVVKTFGGSNGI